MTEARVLVVDDDGPLRETLARGLKKRGFDVVAVASGVEALELVGHEAFDAVLSDVTMRPMSGLELCERLGALRPDLPVILLTGFGSVETVVDALRRGAYDFLQKPLDLDLAVHSLGRAVELRRLRGELRRLREAGAPSPSPASSARARR